MVEPDVTRFEVPTGWLDEAQQAHAAYRAVLPEPHDYTNPDIDSATEWFSKQAARHAVDGSEAT